MTLSIKLKHIIGYWVTIIGMRLYVSTANATDLFYREESAANTFHIACIFPPKQIFMCYDVLKAREEYVS